jgi:hypothetical protein
VAPRYSSSERVADHLGRDLSGALLSEADRKLLAAADWIDAHTGRTWGATASLTELHTITGPAIYLRKTPVGSVASVEVRGPAVGSPWVAQAASAYELMDATAGLLHLAPAYAGWWARVTYTPAQGAVPEHVHLAATLLAAHWLGPALVGEAGGTDAPVKSYALGQELNVTYDTAAASSSDAVTAGVPDSVLALLDRHREVVFA